MSTTPHLGSALIATDWSLKPRFVLVAVRQGGDKRLRSSGVVVFAARGKTLTDGEFFEPSR